MAKYTSYIWEGQFPDDTTIYGIKDTEARDVRDKKDTVGDPIGAITAAWATDAGTNQDFTELSVNVDDETIKIDTDKLKVNLDNSTLLYDTTDKNVRVKYDGYGKTTTDKVTILNDTTNGLYVRLAKADDYDETTQTRTPLTGIPGAAYPDGETIKIDANGAMSATKLNPGDALALDDPDDKFRLNVKVDEKPIRISDDKSKLYLLYDGMDKTVDDDVTLLYDATNGLYTRNATASTWNADDETVLIKEGFDGVSHPDGKTIQLDATTGRITARTAVGPTWNAAEAAVVIEGKLGVSMPDNRTIKLDASNRLYARDAVLPTWDTPETSITVEGKAGVIIPDGKTLQKHVNGYIYAREAVLPTYDASGTLLTAGKAGIVKPDGKTLTLNTITGYLEASSGGDFHLKSGASFVPTDPGLYYVSGGITTSDGHTYNGTWILEYFKVKDDDSTGYAYAKATLMSDTSVVVQRVLSGGTWTEWGFAYGYWYN